MKTVKTTLSPVAIPAEFEPLTWIKEQSEQLMWLLAHTFDGVVWGKRDETGWKLSSDLVGDWPQLEADILQQVRLFGETGEIFVWRDDAGWYGRQIMDGAGDELPYMKESQILWGTYGEALTGGFTRLEDGVQGLVHAVPIEIPSSSFGNSRRPARLVVRHYVTRHKKTGLGRITRSRLLKLEGGQNGS